MVSLTIDGKKVEIEEGSSVLKAAGAVGIQIPTLCVHESLPAYGACRLCMVEATVRGRTKLVASCTMPVAEGMEITTNSEKISKRRKLLIELLLARSPDSPALKELASEFGIARQRLRTPRHIEERTSSIVDESCILCGLCVRMCNDVIRAGVIGFEGRGRARCVTTPFDDISDYCASCGACDFVCPTDAITIPAIRAKHTPEIIPSEFDMGMIGRKPIYISYPQAVPSAPSIDDETCINFKTGGCKVCEDVCEAHAIDHEMVRENDLSIEAGAVIVSPGYDLFDANTTKELGYDRYPNVLNSLEFERLLSASGPTMGQITRSSDGEHPESIAFIQCVGSRTVENNYCSSVCCMYATKEAVIAMEHQPGLECSIFYIDLRAFGKGFDEYIQRAEDLGVRYVRCRPSSIKQDPQSKDVIISYADGSGKIKEQAFSLAVLSCGLNPPKAARELAERLGIQLNSHGFCDMSSLAPVDTSREGVYACGPFTEPKDIPETVMQSSAASARAMALLASEKWTRTTSKEYPPELSVLGQKPRIGVFVCHCGINIGGVIDPKAAAQYASSLRDVVYATDVLYACSQDSIEAIKESVGEHDLNRVVVASCTPRTHEPLFRDSIREVGLNPYLFEMTNIRDQCTWIHRNEPEQAAVKANDLIRMAIARVRLSQPLQPNVLPIHQNALVVGGGVGGMTAALELAEQGFGVHLVEQEEDLGGHARHLHFMLSGEDPQETLAGLIQRVENHSKIALHMETEIVSVEGSCGNFTTKLRSNGEEREVEHGVAIVAIGADEYSPTEYLYGKSENVLTQKELEERLAVEDTLADVKTVVMIQCVGSREPDRPYCSRVCCQQAIKNALLLKERNPDINIYILYRDIRTYGLREEYYTLAREKGIRFIHYDENRKPDVSENGDVLKATVFDTMLRLEMEIETDLVVLAAAIVPSQGAGKLSQMFKIPLNEDGFFLEAHLKLRPVDFSAEGIYLAGLAHAPKTIDETMIQGGAAAARASTIISKDTYVSESIVARVDEEICSACGICTHACPYEAPSLVLKDGRMVCQVNVTLCKGCGSCASVCPSGAMQQLGFKSEGLGAMIEVLLT